MKKQNILLLFTTILTLSMALTAFAAGMEYKISAINVIVTVPEGLYSLGRNVSEGNPALEILDAKPEELYAVYQQKGIYLDAFPKDLSYEIVLVATSVTDADFIKLTEPELQEYTSTLQNEYESMENETLLSVSQYTGGSTDYLVTSSHYEDDYVTSYAMKYYTTKNGIGYNYIIQTNGDEISEEHINMINQLIDSAQYTTVSASISESPFFTMMMEYLIGGGLSIIALAFVLFLLMKSSKKH